MSNLPVYVCICTGKCEMWYFVGCFQHPVWGYGGGFGSQVVADVGSLGEIHLIAMRSQGLTNWAGNERGLARWVRPID